MKLKRVIPLIFTMLVLLSINDSHSQIIKHINIKGNTKTKEKAIIKWGEIKIGQEISQEDLEQIIEKLKRAYQFNLRAVRFEGDTLFIDIEDKWSLFPVPMITQSGDYYSRGVFLYENNFLGRLGTFAPGIFWTNSGFNGILYYQEDNLLANSVGMKVLLLHKSDLTEFERKGNVIDQFETRFDTVILTPNIHNGRQDHKLGPIYVKKKIFKAESKPIFQSERLGLYYRHHYNNFIKLPVLFDGVETTYDFFLLPDRRGKFDFLQGGDIQYCKPYGNNFFKVQMHFHHTNNSGYLSPKILGGNEGHRGYDRESLPVQRNIGFMLQPQIHLWDRVYGAPFYEFNHSKLIRPVDNGLKMNESTAGLSLSYYFKTISIPAIIIEYARNLDDRSDHIHLNVGLKL